MCCCNRGFVFCGIGVGSRVWIIGGGRFLLLVVGVFLVLCV